MDGELDPSYYNDLLNRVDSTLTENRSAYGNPERENEVSNSLISSLLPLETRRIHIHVLWGEEGNLDQESRLVVLVLFVAVSGALSFSICKAEDLIWFLQWFLVTLLTHLGALILRFALSRVEDLETRRMINGIISIGLLIWIIAAMATCTQAEIGSGFLLWFAVITLGAILVEASARIFVRFFGHRFLGGSPLRHYYGNDSSDDLQYAAL
mmetsp:Transcript_10678/g.14784  ORF Transcript_10678/g.14784 Transcript_10678/m.14784 type:complete len:211 (-) Transcript_10678:277-909(-)